MEDEKKELHWFETLQGEERKSKEQRNRTGTPVRTMEPKSRGEAMNIQKTINLGKYVEETERWIDEVAVHIKVGERKDWAWNALRGVLHAIRDRLSPEEVFHLSAQLPMLVRGLFLEGYHIGNKPEKYHVDELKNRIESGLGPGADVAPDTAFKAVLLVLYGHVSEGELNDIYGTLPKDIRRLWDKSLQTFTV